MVTPVGRHPVSDDSGWNFHGIDPGEELPDVDTSVAHSARIYDYILGGKDNFEADRRAAEAAMKANPSMVTGMRENRALMRRMTAFLAGEAGIRQFLDLGTGLPTSPNMHEIAQSLRPDSRVVYVDNDPIVLVHARALLTSNNEGSTAYIHAALRQPEKILADPRLMDTLEDDAHAVVGRLLAALPSGSYLAIQHPTRDFYAEGVGADRSYRNAGIAFQYRTRAEFERFLDGLELVPPGIVPMTEWRPEGDPKDRPAPAEASAYGAVGRKP